MIFAHLSMIITLISKASMGHISLLSQKSAIQPKSMTIDPYPSSIAQSC
jgi:hypothetical protein